MMYQQHNYYLSQTKKRSILKHWKVLILIFRHPKSKATENCCGLIPDNVLQQSWPEIKITYQ